MRVDEFIARLKSFGTREAIIWRDHSFTFDEILRLSDDFVTRFSDAMIAPGAVVAVEGDFSPASVAALLALIATRRIALPSSSSARHKRGEYFETAGVELTVRLDGRDNASLETTGRQSRHELISRLQKDRHPGIVLFTSGTTGPGKGAVHDFELLARKYLQPRHCYRTLAFLLFDHIGGLDTLLYNLANGSCLIVPLSLSPDDVCTAIETHKVEVLPVSPSFVNLLLLSGAVERHDLSTIRIVTYGAEVMPPNTLRRFSRAVPHARLLQKFGATEIGTMRSKSRSSDSVWVKIGGEGFETRVVDGILHVKAESAMLGYLNAPSPFTEDGWFITGDEVEVDGEYLRILGRKSEIINLGGQKVFPAEVEAVLVEMDNVRDVMVRGTRNPITGQMVEARFELEKPEELRAFRRRVLQYCAGRLPRHQTPSRIEIATEPLSNDRMKKIRK